MPNRAIILSILILLSAVSLTACSPKPVAHISPHPVTTYTTEPLSVRTPAPQLSPLQVDLLQGSRSTLGDVYDDGYYAGGPPPTGRGACTDVVYSAYLAAGINLQDSIEDDIAARPSGYPNLGDGNINYRRAPNLIVWFERHTKSLPPDSDFQAGDVVFWSLADDGVADHVGVVSDKAGYVIHNIGPQCREDASLRSWKILGHYRIRN